MSDAGLVKKRLAAAGQAIQRFADKSGEDLVRAADMVIETFQAGGRVLVFGNGGSAAQAQHIAAELVNRMLFDRPPLAAVALTTDTSVLTSIANDSDFDSVFAKQVEGLGRAGDLVWGLSTSGRSKNVNAALEAGEKLGMKRLAMAGRPGSPMENFADLALCVDEDSTPLIQEVHLAAAHVICELVEERLFREPGK